MRHFDEKCSISSKQLVTSLKLCLDKYQTHIFRMIPSSSRYEKTCELHPSVCCWTTHIIWWTTGVCMGSNAEVCVCRGVRGAAGASCEREISAEPELCQPCFPLQEDTAFKNQK